jgi:hypothetical protein
MAKLSRNDATPQSLVCLNFLVIANMAKAFCVSAHFHFVAPLRRCGKFKWPNYLATTLRRKVWSV